MRKKSFCISGFPENEIFEGWCWPGDSYYADFLNYEKISLIYKEFFKNEKYFLNSSIIHTWIDMNEPSVFNQKEITMPKDCIHFDGDQHVSHREVHNIYGYMYQKVTHESLQNRYNNKLRPFVLSRSFFAGSQKYGFIWTGDNKSTWDFLKTSIDNLLSISLCGLSACGSDVGGFADNPTEELMKAWYEVGVFYPFFRGHSHNETIRREPWLFSKETFTSIKKSICLRYNLLSFWYTKFYNHSCDGVPILKPLWYKYPKYYKELVSKNEISHFIVGNEFIIIPYLGKKQLVFLPDLLENYFYNFDNGKLITHENIIELNEQESIKRIVIGGSIITWTDRIGVSALFTKKKPMSLMIYLDKNGNANGNVYFDDGVSFNYKNSNYVKLEFRFTDFNCFEIKNCTIKLENYEDINIPMLDCIYILGLNSNNKRIIKIMMNGIQNLDFNYDEKEILVIKLNGLEHNIFTKNEINIKLI